jgi:hypothetical protein
MRQQIEGEALPGQRGNHWDIWRWLYTEGADTLRAMDPETRIDFTEASHAFICDEYYMSNFIAFLEANSVFVHPPKRIESVTAKKMFLLKLTNESQPLKQEQGDALIAQFLAADKEIKSRK